MLSPPAIVAIVLLSFLYAGYHEWLKARTDRESNAAPEELTARLQTLEEHLAQVEQERDELAERVQNLETIVTSEAWIAQHEGEIDVSTLTLASPPESDSDREAAEEHTAELARRLRSNEATNGDF